MSRRLGIRRIAGHSTPAGLIKATSAPTTLPGGATIPAGSQVTDATSMLGALQGRTAMGVNGAVPLPRDQQYWALMGPGAPLYPAPLNQPNPATGQADPRRWQYPVSWNLIQDEGRLIDWSTLRDAARQVDLISQCIRVRRTEQSSLEWDITLTRRTIEANGITSSQDKKALLKRYSAEISRLIDFWSEPDTTNGYTWPEWVEMLIHEMMVTDAVSIFPLFTYGGQLLSLENVDGATIKPLLDERGNRPRAPAAAYQQWLYGFPRGEYTDAGAGEPDWSGTAGSLIYKPRYTRVESPYGYSPVEQALVSANLWLRRQQWMVAEYTEGTTPRMMLESSGISGYTPEQIRAWQSTLNDFYGGSTENRQRIRMFPDGFKPHMLSDEAERYKPEYDEFLIKLICAHMDVQPQEIGFTPRNGLGGAGHGESQEAITYRKALRPTAQWLVGIMNQISYAYLGMPRDLTFQFLGLEDEDQDLADQTMDRQFRAGRMTLNETRDKLGQPRYDFEEADKPMIVTQRGVVFLEGAAELAVPGALVGPPDAPAAPTEGADATPEDGEPVDDEAGAENDGTDEEPPKPAAKGNDDEPTSAQKSELAAYRNWARKDRKRPFEFHQMSKVDAQRWLGNNLGRVLFKAGGSGPKARSGQTWAGWTKDLEVSAYWTAEISRAFRGLIDTRALADAWAEARGIGKADQPSHAQITDAVLWLTVRASQGGQDVAAAITAALEHIQDGVWTDGYYVGDRAAVWAAREEIVRAARATGEVLPVEAHGEVTARIDWGAWTPGDTDAAKRVLGGGLQRLLDRAEVTISSIVDNRMDDLAEVLADGLNQGLAPATIARNLDGVLEDSKWASLVAETETARAVTVATQDRYLSIGVTANTWMTAADQRVCPACRDNESAGAVAIGQSFPSGSSGPPGHPRCRCALAPVVDSISNIYWPTLESALSPVS